VEYRDWAPIYDRIRAEFGFPFEREAASADALEARAGERLAEDPLDRLRPVLAPSAGRRPGR